MQSFFMKISFHSYANKTSFSYEELYTYPRFHNEVYDLNFVDKLKTIDNT